MKLTELVSPRAIIPVLSASDRNGVVRELVAALEAAGDVPAGMSETVIRSIISRERTRGTTGFGKGVAAPHAKIDGLSRVVGAIGRSTRGVDFSSLDGGLVYCVVLILSPASDAEQHLVAMNLVFKHLQNERFRKFLRQSDTTEKIYDLLKETDERLSAI